MYLIYTDRLGNKSICNPERTKWIPFADDNTEYQAYLAWVAEGNVAEEITEGAE
jgi:hypothetical protein